MFRTYYNPKNRHIANQPMLRDTPITPIFRKSTFWVGNHAVFDFINLHKWISYSLMALAVCEKPKLSLMLRLSLGYTTEKGQLLFTLFLRPFFVTDFDENGLFLGLGPEVGFNMGISHPAGTISEHFFHLGKAKNTKILKLHCLPIKV